MTSLPEGRWIPVSPDYPGVEVCVTGTPEDFAETYLKLTIKRQRTTGEIHPKLRDYMIGRSFSERRLSGVRGLFHDKAKTQSVSLIDFRQRLIDPDYSDFAATVIAAVTDADAISAADIQTKTEGAQS